MTHKKIESVTDEFWENEVNFYNKELIESFLEQAHLSPATLKQYKSALRIFAKWVEDHAKGRDGKGKDIPDLKPRDALKYQNWLISKELSSSAIKFKRSVVSALCGYIEVYYSDEHKDFRNIFTKAIPSVAKNAVKEKVPLTTKEIEKIVKVLTKKKDWQKIAYIWFTYSTGCRREESRQLLAEVKDYKKHVDKDGKEKAYYVTHPIRAKGRGKEGKVRRFTFDERTMKAIQKWIEYRESQVSQTFSDTCPHLFVSKGKDGYRQISANTFNLWCKEFSKILGGKAVHPHLFRSSRATNAVIEDGKDITKVQKLLGHESSQTTEIYVVRDDSDDLDDLY